MMVQRHCGDGELESGRAWARVILRMVKWWLGAATTSTRTRARGKTIYTGQRVSRWYV